MTVNLRLELRRDGGDGSQGVRKTATSPGLGMLMDCLRTCTLLVVMADVAAVDILSQCRIYTIVAAHIPGHPARCGHWWPVAGPMLVPCQRSWAAAEPATGSGGSAQEAALSTVNTLSRLLKTVEICQQCQHPPVTSAEFQPLDKWGNWR